MKNITKIFLLIILLTSCIPFFTGYPMTRFYVKNNSNKVIRFKSSVLKYSSITAPYLVTVPFTIQPHDSVLARYVGAKENTKTPQSWFKKFIIQPVDGVKINDPNLPENWKKYFDKDGPFYTFIIAEK